tara:strand:+ start:3373 stop:3705 length:333 start_codon:yes stop_codon:yes gene_type:complete
MAYAKIENKIVVFKTYEVDMTLTEIPDNVCCGMIQNEDGSFSNQPKQFNDEMIKLRDKRNNLLAKTDWRASSDLQLSKKWASYRQSLRDITEGISSVSDIEAISWPKEPT